MTDLFESEQDALLQPASREEGWGYESLCEGCDVHVTNTSFLKLQSNSAWAAGLVMHTNLDSDAIICEAQPMH